MSAAPDGRNETGVRMEGGGGVEGGCVLLGCLTSQQYTSVSQGRICSDNLYVLPR